MAVQGFKDHMLKVSIVVAYGGSTYFKNVVKNSFQSLDTAR